MLAAGELSGIPPAWPQARSGPALLREFHFTWRPPVPASDEAAERAVREPLAQPHAGGCSAFAGQHSSPRAGRLARLSPADAANTRVESHGGPKHVAAISVVDGAALPDAAGRLRLEKVRADLELRLHSAPRLRQVLVWPRRGLGPPAGTDRPGGRGPQTLPALPAGRPLRAAGDGLGHAPPAREVVAMLTGRRRGGRGCLSHSWP